jgi:hypothetical protein
MYNKEEEDGHKFVTITDPASFPSDMLGLHNHIQICNLYTMSPANGNNDEGNPKLQCPTYVVLQVTIKYAFNHIVGLIQSYLTEMNMFVKEKEIQSLNTRTYLAIIGTTADWCHVYISQRLCTRTWSVTLRASRQAARWMPNFVTTGSLPPCSGRTKCGCP